MVQSHQSASVPETDTSHNLQTTKEIKSNEKGSKDESSPEINPYIPKYISKAPWYTNSDSSASPSLHHQKATLISDSIPQKHEITLIQSTKYRKGACDNCGSATHSRRDCLERPRKIGAKWSGKDICPDEIINDPSDISLSSNALPGTKLLSNYDQKRDHWKNFDGSAFSQNVEPLYEGVLSRFISKDHPKDEVEGSLGQKLDFESKSRMTVRNLRIREDTAKYLQKNISENIIYDPKTRALIKTDPETIIQERWVRASFSDSTLLPTDLDVFCWDPQRKTIIIPQANPTLAALEYENFKKSSIQIPTNILAHKPVSSPISNEESPSFAESSKNGHTSIWGSFWDNHLWGYACCHSLDFSSKCTRFRN